MFAIRLPSELIDAIDQESARLKVTITICIRDILAERLLGGPIGPLKRGGGGSAKSKAGLKAYWAKWRAEHGKPDPAEMAVAIAAAREKRRLRKIEREKHAAEVAARRVARLARKAGK